MTVLVLAVAVLALAVGILIAYVVLQDAMIRAQRKTNDILTRAVSREHAAADIARAELEDLTRAAQIRNIWTARNPTAKAWLS